MNRPKTLLVNDQQIEMKLSIEYISFSAHADCQQTAEYIKQLQPPNIVLVHGDANEMKKLQNNL
jgi:cleavage and polyadenylation specificity factor subunit 3